MGFLSINSQDPTKQHREDGEADYVGAWAAVSFEEILQEIKENRNSRDSFFDLFVKERIPLPGNRGQAIQGRIIDGNGGAEFEGIESEDAIEFTKRYSKQAVSRGGAPEALKYRGVKATKSIGGKGGEWYYTYAAGLIRQNPRIVLPFMMISTVMRWRNKRD